MGVCNGTVAQVGGAGLSGLDLWDTEWSTLASAQRGVKPWEGRWGPGRVLGKESRGLGCRSAWGRQVWWTTGVSYLVLEGRSGCGEHLQMLRGVRTGLLGGETP